MRYMKGESMKKLAVFAIGSLLVVGCAGSAQVVQQTPVPTPTPTEEPVSAIPGIGESLLWNDSHLLTVLKVDDSVAGVFEADPGFKYVAVEVVFEAIGEIEYNALVDFEIRDNDGYTYSYAIWGGKDPSLGSGTIRPGQKARGWVSFEVAEDATGLTLVYEQFLVGNWGEWDLGQ
jgi:hypothetical protein